MTQLTLSYPVSRALLEAAAEAGLPAPVSLDPAANRQAVITWTPDLSAPQLATLTTLQSLAIGASLITVTERQNIQSDIDLLVTFQGVATPTLAQTAAATKAQSRILRAILRS